VRLLTAACTLCVWLQLALAPAALASTPGTWTRTGSAQSTNVGATAVRLASGTVFLGGGSVGTGSVQGLIPFNPELFNPASGTWRSTTPPPQVQFLPTVTLLTTGKILLAGGDQASQASGTAQLYDPTSDTWQPTGSLHTPRSDHTATLLSNGKVLVAGGTQGSGPLTSAELYDPASGTWSTTGSLHTARRDAYATLLQDGRVLVVGGCSTNCTQTLLTSAELYNPSSGTWSATGSISVGRTGASITLLKSGKVLLAGGADLSASGPSARLAELFDPSTGKWSQAGSLLSGRSGHTATLLDSGLVLVAGGVSLPQQQPVPAESAELYDPVLGLWTFSGSMNDPRADHAATTLANGTVLVAGGFDAEHNALASAEIYTPPAPSPVCLLTGTGTSSSGQKTIQISTGDSSSGLRSVQVTEASNATVSVPTFTPGTQSVVVVTATKVNQSAASSVALRVTNVSGQSIDCDPGVLTVGRGPGADSAQVLHHLAQSESHLILVNGTPGVRRVDVHVNGHTWQLTDLSSGQTVDVDVSSAMREGTRNSVRVVAHGSPASTAMVIVADP
jgi:hypothetical protein